MPYNNKYNQTIASEIDKINRKYIEHCDDSMSGEFNGEFNETLHTDISGGVALYHKKMNNDECYQGSGFFSKTYEQKIAGLEQKIAKYEAKLKVLNGYTDSYYESMMHSVNYAGNPKNNFTHNKLYNEKQETLTKLKNATIELNDTKHEQLIVQKTGKGFFSNAFEYTPKPQWQKEERKEKIEEEKSRKNRERYYDIFKKGVDIANIITGKGISGGFELDDDIYERIKMSGGTSTMEVKLNKTLKKAEDDVEFYSNELQSMHKSLIGSNPKLIRSNVFYNIRQTEPLLKAAKDEMDKIKQSILNFKNREKEIAEEQARKVLKQRTGN